MNYEEDGNDLLMSSGNGTPWAKWENNGDVVTGIVQGPPKVKQARDYDTGQPKTYPSGDPVLNVVVMVQTGKINPEYEDDTGVRQIVIRKGSPMHIAVQVAVKAAKVKGLEAGGQLTITRTGEEKLKNSRGMSYTQRTFSAKYEPPTDDQVTEQQALGALAGMLKDPPF